MSIETAISDKIVAAGLGTFESTTGWGIFIGREPTTPDTAIIIARSGGLSPNPKWLLDYPNIQVRVRGAKHNYSGAHDKGEEIKDLLLGITSQDVDGDRWVSITMPGDMGFIGYDENDRPHFSLNFQMIVEPGVPAVTNREAL